MYIVNKKVKTVLL